MIGGSPLPFAIASRKSMGTYLQPQDDGLPTRESGSWVVEKLDYLKRYIDVFETSMRDKLWRRRHYIDLFAGPGKCSVPKGAVYLGSPLLALVHLGKNARPVYDRGLTNTERSDENAWPQTDANRVDSSAT
jgi:hypothetical protein